MKRKRYKWLVTLGVALVVISALAAVGIIPALAATVNPSGGEIDLTTTGDRAVMPDGAIFESYNPTTATGSGVFDAFVRISKANTEEVQGYNTDYRPLEFEENKSPSFTRSWKLSDVPLVPVYDTDGITLLGMYREFQYDINQHTKSPENLLSLDDVEIYLTDDDMATGYPFTGEAELVWELDDGQNWWLKLDYNLAAGSGKRDLILYVPDSYFQGSSYGYCPYGASGCNTYVTLFSRFGGEDNGTTIHYVNNDGYEEWGVAVYEPATKSGYKFEDLNADGVWDPDGEDDIAGNSDDERGLAGWTIYVDYEDDGLSLSDPQDETDSTGYYEIAGIVEGTFKVKEEPPTGETDWFCSYPSPNCWHEVAFEWGMGYTDNNFGNYQTAKIYGYKWHDKDADGIWDAEEEGINGWTINLSGDDTDSTTTAYNSDTSKDGYFEFVVEPGTYNLAESCQPDWLQSFPAPDNGCGSGTHDSITVVSQQEDGPYNFGNYQHADLEVSKSGKITYTIIVTNNGPAVALNVVVDDYLPGNLTWTINPAVSEFTITGNHLHGVIASLASGASVSVTVEATINDSCESPLLGNDVTVETDTYDPDLTNNTDDADICPSP